MEHFKEEYAYAPDINPVVVLQLEDHLRCHVLISPAECGPFCVDIDGTPAEITEFYVEAVIEQQVFRLSRLNAIP